MDKRGISSVVIILLSLGVVAAAVVFYLYDGLLLRVISGVVFLILIISLFTEIMFHFVFGSSNKLRKEIREMENILKTESLDVLKQKYVIIYNTYLKVSAKDKQNFYGRVMKLRSSLEEIMKTSKQVEDLFASSKTASIQEKQSILQQIIELQKSLPDKEQDRFHSEVGYLSSELESGK